MSENNKERKSSLDKRIVWFFVFAILCVAAFLIVVLVRTCTTEHEEKEEEQIELQQTGMLQDYTITQDIA